MLRLVSRIDQNVINESYHKLVQFVHEDEIHEIHEVGKSISESKRHNQVFIKVVSGGESGLWNVRRFDFYLVIARSEVNFGEDLGSQQLIKKHINAGQRVLFFIVTALRGR
jgi:hypothetical protein